MCGIKSKKFYVPLLVSFLLFSPLCLQKSYATVTLTDTEAKEIWKEIEQSKKDLTEAQKESAEAQKELNQVKNMQTEQKESYEKQLKEAKKKERRAWTVTGCSSATSVLLATILLIVIL